MRELCRVRNIGPGHVTISFLLWPKIMGSVCVCPYKYIYIVHISSQNFMIFSVIIFIILKSDCLFRVDFFLKKINVFYLFIYFLTIGIWGKKKNCKRKWASWNCRMELEKSRPIFFNNQGRGTITLKPGKHVNRA